jgi:hypothetical protein|tara:strand:- start:1009 stop:1197 length:189 start_codon:yes stop_codon:yes gene_type:complete
MIHKVSELCNKIDGIKKVADRLRDIKYNQPKSQVRDAEVDNMISDIQSQCRLVANDKGVYNG